VRALADQARLREFMRELGAAAEQDGRVYFTGGATAVLMGWRSSTIDADIRLVPESDAVFRAIPALKERLRLDRYPAIDPPSFRRALDEALAAS
jgi:hypothetical protein